MQVRRDCLQQFQTQAECSPYCRRDPSRELSSCSLRRQKLRNELEEVSEEVNTKYYIINKTNINLSCEILNVGRGALKRPPPVAAPDAKVGAPPKRPGADEAGCPIGFPKRVGCA